MTLKEKIKEDISDFIGQFDVNKKIKTIEVGDLDALHDEIMETIREHILPFFE